MVGADLAQDLVDLLDLLREAIVEAAQRAPARAHLFDEQIDAVQDDSDDVGDDDRADADLDDRIPTSPLAEPR